MEEYAPNNQLTAFRALTQRHEALLRGLGAFGEMAELLGANLPLDQLCTRLLDLLLAATGAENASLMFLRPEDNELELQAVADPLDAGSYYLGPGSWSGKRFGLGEGVAGYVAQSGQPLRIDDTQSDDRFEAIESGAVPLRSLMCFPLISAARIIGVMNFSHSTRAFFDSDTERIVRLLAPYAAQMLLKPMLDEQVSSGGDALSARDAPTADALLVLEASGKIVHANDAVAALTGHDVVAWLAGEDWLDKLHPEDQPRLEQYRRDALTGQPALSLSYRFRLPSGVYRLLAESALPIMCVGGGRRLAIVLHSQESAAGAALDVKRAEIQQLQAQKIRVLSEMASGMAHDLGNLLHMISASLDLALMEADPIEMRRRVQEARNATGRAAEVVQKLHDFGRAERLVKRRVEAASLVNEVASIILNTFNKRIQVHVEHPDSEDLLCEVDSAQIYVALLNLCLNARDALGERLEQDSAEAHLRLGAEAAVFPPGAPGTREGDERRRWVRLFVADNGIGMSPEVRARIFEPFFTTKAEGKGTGLGLATTYRVVKQHDGWMDVRTSEGAGSTFSIFLPQALNQAAAEVSPHESVSGSEAILVVDDEQMVCNLAQAVLHQNGYHVFEAAGGEEALAVLEKHGATIRLAIVDEHMPGMAGHELLAHTRREWPHLRVILSTGMAGPEDLRLPEDLQPDAWLHKPYLVSALTRVVRETLGVHAI